MNRAIPDEIIEEIRARTDIAELIGSYIPLKHSGATWKACCPFHDEKTPSFHVTPQRGRYHCFGCGKSGDVFRFVMDYEGVDFPTSAHLLASRCGVIIPEKQYTSPAEAQQAKVARNRKDRVYTLHEALGKYYVDCLWKDQLSPVHQYFMTRDIPEELALHFGIGAAPDGWDTTLNWGLSQGFTIDEMLDGGIILASERNPGKFYDRFRNRLVFPIWNEQGKVVAFSARTVEAQSDGAKYVNSPETMIFRKSHVLYALPLARQAMQKQGFFILCEGQLDTIAMHRAGFTNAVAPQGTAFTHEQAQILRRYSDKAYICFDSDGAGIKATLRAFEILLPMEFEIKVITLPGGKDPDELLKNEGPEAVARAVEGAGDFFEFLYRQKAAEHDASSPMGITRIVTDFIGYLQRIKNSVTRSMYASRLADMLGINENAVFNELNKFRKKEKFEQARRDGFKAKAEQQQLPQSQQGAPMNAPSVEPQQTSVDILNMMPKEIVHAEKTLLALALVDEGVAQRLGTELPSDQLSETVLGRAINEIVRLTMGGEWDLSFQHLSDMERENPDPVLGEILADSREFKEKFIKKASGDCINAIKNHFHDRKKNDILSRLRSASTPEEKQDLMKQLMALPK